MLLIRPQADPSLRKATDAHDSRDRGRFRESNGYLNTYYVEGPKALRMQQHTQEVGQELYNMGHFLQGAIAYYRATGDATMLNAGIRVCGRLPASNLWAWRESDADCVGPP